VCCAGQGACRHAPQVLDKVQDAGHVVIVDLCRVRGCGPRHQQVSCTSQLLHGYLPNARHPAVKEEHGVYRHLVVAFRWIPASTHFLLNGRWLHADRGCAMPEADPARLEGLEARKRTSSDSSSVGRGSTVVKQYLWTSFACIVPVRVGPAPHLCDHPAKQPPNPACSLQHRVGCVANNL
jgi:hypothetical protein